MDGRGELGSLPRARKARSLRSGAGSQSFDRLIADLCRAFVRVTVDGIDDEIDKWLEQIVLRLGLDRSTMAEIDSSGWGSFSHGWAREPSRIVRQPLDANLLLPWLLKKVSAGETVIVPRLDDLPEEAAVDRESFRRHGTKSNVTIPIFAGSEVVGGVGFATMYREREWPPRVVEQLRLVAEIFGYALERKKRVAEIHRLRDELTHVSRVTTVGQLATSIAHELNQPLAAIMNNTEAAQLLLGSDHPNLEETREALKGVIYDAGRASDIVARFRQLFKRRELRKSRLSANELFETVERILRSAATIKNVMLHFSIAPSLPHFAAESDPDPAGAPQSASQRFRFGLRHGRSARDRGGGCARGPGFRQFCGARYLVPVSSRISCLICSLYKAR